MNLDAKRDHGGSYASDAQNEAIRRRADVIRQVVNFVPLFACVTLGILYFLAALWRGYDLSIGFSVVISDATLVALVATGATFIFTSGSFDLSLGANMLVSALLGGLVGKATGNIWLLVLTSLGTAIALSTLNALLATFFNLPVFIMTIVMMNVYGAVSTLILTSLGTNAALAVPMSLVAPFNHTAFRVVLLVGFEVFCCVLFYLLPVGREQRFLGGNPLCAFLSGIRAKPLTLRSFALAGIGIGLAAFSMIVETPTLSASSGSSVGMNMLIALVFGGMKMSGGPASKMYAALLGAFSMAFLDAFVNIFVTGSWYLQIIKGVLFVIVVFLFSVARRSSMLER